MKKDENGNPLCNKCVEPLENDSCVTGEQSIFYHCRSCGTKYYTVNIGRDATSPPKRIVEKLKMSNTTKGTS